MRDVIWSNVTVEAMMRRLLLGLACVVVVLGCSKKSDSPTPGGGSVSPVAAPKEQGKDQANDQDKDQLKDHSAAVKALIDSGLAVAKGGDKAKIASWCKELVLPNPEAWLKRVFGDPLGKKIAAEYAESSKDFSEVGGVLEDANKRGASEVRIVRVTAPNDADATGLQQSALGAMKEKVPLYTAKFCEPGKTESSLSLWSFVVVKGKPYLLGKMKAVK